MLNSPMRVHDIFEQYTQANSYLLRYLKDEKFDPYTYWSELRLWFEENPEYIDLLSEITGQDFQDADQINEEEPDLFFKLPPDVQNEAAEWVTAWLARHAPEEMPTYTQTGLASKRLLPRTTWLVHFTNDPEKVADEGFKIGMHDVNKLGLTTRFFNGSFEKQYGGYNFAFLANSRYARWAASEHKYGKHAVMFQNSGVLTHHYADEEQQVIFRGEDVDPRDIIILRSDGSEWHVRTRRPTRRNYRDYTATIFTGDFETCVRWVEQHCQQYRHYLTLR